MSEILIWVNSERCRFDVIQGDLHPPNVARPLIVLEQLSRRLKSHLSVGDAPLTVLEALRFLVDHEASIHIAARHGQVEAVRMLVDEYGVDADERRYSFCYSALHEAAAGGHANVAAFLLDRSAKVNARDHRGWTPLMNAAFSGNVECVELLLNRGADLAARSYQLDDSIGVTAFDLAHSESCGDTPFARARDSRRTEVMQLLLDRGHILTGEFMQSMFPQSSDNEACERAVSTSPSGSTSHSVLLQLFESEDYLQIEDSLPAAELKAPAELSVFDAASTGDAAALIICLQKGANVLQTDGDGNTLLHHAAAGGGVEAMELLIKCGVDVNQMNEFGQTALYAAVKNRKLRAVRCLLNQGAEVDKRGHRAFTPLMLAVLQDDEACVNLLIDFNVNPGATATHCWAKGKTAVDIAAAGLSRFSHRILEQLQVYQKRRALARAPSLAEVLARRSTISLASHSLPAAHNSIVSAELPPQSSEPAESQQPKQPLRRSGRYHPAPLASLP